MPTRPAWRLSSPCIRIPAHRAPRQSPLLSGLSGVALSDPLAKRQNVRSIQDTTSDTAADASTRVSRQLSIMDSVVVPAATAHVGRRTRRHTFRGPS